VVDLDVLERAHLVKGQTKETNHNVYRQYELTTEGAELVEKLSKETMSDKEPHQPHTLGAPSSQEIPVSGVEPTRFLVQIAAKPSRPTQRWRDTEIQLTTKQKDTSKNEQISDIYSC
jgi:DNA-binding PadR family transcriptional regulator